MSVQDQRPRFFEGQYLGAADLETALAYGQVRDARHALAAHTWGIAAGLWLIERPVPGTTAVDVYLEPGYAWDGFGRPIVVLARYRIPAALLADIKYDALIDAAGKGRLIPVWLRYDERRFQEPAPGFATCESDDQRSRIEETFAIEIGDRTDAERHAGVSIDGRTVTPDVSQPRLNPASRIFYDETAAAQALPDAPDARWLVPVGYVRWLPSASGPGRFVARDDVQAKDGDAIRRFRRYVGAVAEEILAADRVLRVRDRTRRPSPYFARPPAFDPNETNPAQLPPVNDLLFVEGATRVEGDVRLVGGALDLLTSDARDRDTPLRIRRTERSASASGPAAVEIAIGVTGRPEGRLAVGPLPAAGVNLDEKLTVLGGGNVGVSTTEPATKLHVTGDRVRLESGAKRIDLATDKTGVDLLSDTNSVYIHATGTPPKHVLLNPLTDEGNVGVGTEAPATKLHVTGKRVRLEDAGKRLDLATDQAGVDLLSDTHSVYIHATGTPPNNHVLLNPMPGEGNVGIGTDAPTHKLHIKTTSGIRQNALYLSGDAGWASISYNAHHNAANSAWLVPDSSHKSVTIEMDDVNGTPRFEVFSTLTGIAGWRSHLKVNGTTDTTSMAHSTTGRVGVGTDNPQRKLHVVGDRIRLEGGGKHVDLRTDGSAVDLHSETSSLYLRSSGPSGHNNVVINHTSQDGFVGIGLETPAAKLHVAGSRDADADYLSSYVAVVENTSAGSSADVLALKVGTAHPRGSNNFITFFNGTQAVGCIEGSAGPVGYSDGVKLVSGHADFAECLLLADDADCPEPGDVVGIFEGHVSRRTTGAQHVSAVTSQAVVVGNAPADARTPHATVAFVGQVPVKVRGRVRAGDWILASGRDDGTATACASDALDAGMADRIVGQAWESSDDENVKLVKTVIGVRSNAGVAGLTAQIAAQQAQIDALERQIQRLRGRSDTADSSDR